MYSATITREHPTAFVVLIDRSGSMGEQITFAERRMTKAAAVSLVAGSFIDELLHRARRDDGVRDYYDIAVLGYGGGPGAGAEGCVESLVSPAGKWALPSRLAARAVERVRLSRERLLPTGRSVLAVTEHNVWIPERAAGPTPMCGALREALRMVERWCKQPGHAESYPPTIINITDGEASDGTAEEVRELARRLRATGTADGNTMLVNIHLARHDDAAGAILFPFKPEELPDQRYARLLWDISSPLPDGTGRRALGWCSRAADVVALLNIGSVNSVMI